MDLSGRGGPVRDRLAGRAEDGPVEGQRLWGVLIAIAFMLASGSLLWLAQREIPLGTSYAVWTSIGAVGTFFYGVMIYGDPASLGRFLGVGLILGGVVVLKLAH